MGKKGWITAIVLAVIALVMAITGGFLHFYTKNVVKDKLKGVSLACYVCHGSKNLGMTYRTYEHDVIRNVRTTGTETPVTSFDQCLHHPHHLHHCQKGEYCAMFYVKINDVEDVERKCFRASKPGCETRAHKRLGLEEKTCFCKTNRCKDTPFKHDKPVTHHTTDRAYQFKGRSPGLAFRNHRRRLKYSYAM